jgi:hypothetical protein
LKNAEELCGLWNNNFQKEFTQISQKTSRLLTTVGDMQGKHKKYQVSLKDLVQQEKITQ